jgi:DNA-binding PadR family transcriptional regulator
MTPDPFLSEFEIYVMSAIARLGDEAYGMTILGEIEVRTGRQLAVGAVYAALARLTDKGLVANELKAPLPIKGGRARRHVRLTPAGKRTLAHSATMLARMIPAALRSGGLK